MDLRRWSLATLIALVSLTSACGDGASRRLVSQGDFPNQASGVHLTSACDTLSSYAYEGIPATYIDDGADLLYILAGEFATAGRNDIASSIERIVDLTYQGPAGQITAKSELMSLANSAC